MEVKLKQNCCSAAIKNRKQSLNNISREKELVILAETAQKQLLPQVIINK